MFRYGSGDAGGYTPAAMQKTMKRFLKGGLACGR